MHGIPRIYRSYEEFERDELRGFEKLDMTVDEMLDELFCDELDVEDLARKRRRDDDEIDLALE